MTERERFVENYHRLARKYDAKGLHQRDVEYRVIMDLAKITGEHPQDVSYCIHKWIGGSDYEKMYD